MTVSDTRRIPGAFIRAHRERLSPPDKAGRRRTPGWRREELADAAGLGVTWITWLEQGRHVDASVPALSRLADALQLNAAERASLFDLAGKRDRQSEPETAEALSDALLHLPSMLSAPAYLLDHVWTARAWNPAAAELFTGWLDDTAETRNLLRYVFLVPTAQSLIVDWQERTRRLVAEFRADFNRRPGDTQMQALVDDLLGQSQRFAEHWQNQDVLYREGGERSFCHPEQGILHFQQTTLLVAAQQTIKLVCLAQD
ncbi:helix-turn-helix transcriptional regulator [Pectobacteriaceae bacterium C52]|nr:helix-turn-helix transcriptional regulator [Pectobacteriaceae bacterium C52]